MCSSMRMGVRINVSRVVINRFYVVYYYLIMVIRVGKHKSLYLGLMVYNILWHIIWTHGFHHYLSLVPSRSQHNLINKYKCTFILYLHIFQLCSLMCIGGSSKSLMIVNVCPSVSNLSETLLSLNFSARARNSVLSLGNRDTIKKWRDVVSSHSHFYFWSFSIRRYDFLSEAFKNHYNYCYTHLIKLYVDSMMLI